MGYYISVTQPHEPIPAPPLEASEAEWDRWVEQEAQFSVYSERLGSLGYISQWVFQIAAQLELPLLTSLLGSGGCLAALPELDALEHELDALEREWRRRRLHLPGADVGWGRTCEDLLFPLQCFRDALEAARRTGLPWCVWWRGPSPAVTRTGLEAVLSSDMPGRPARCPPHTMSHI